MFKKPYIIAEAGCNHMGQMEIAHDPVSYTHLFWNLKRTMSLKLLLE